ncbi:MAG: hypothetical protein OQJ89_15000 [Kangiellaceae bacterium]|nr:hypothetical protein [Kangiellaceae bacterium]MCW8999822.1 hypothetical protein [Kangiellaceae bacterium]MCW9018277.1 hypothetical protein [Kangiellaceae bacterium]
MHLNFSFILGLLLIGVGTSLVFYFWQQRKSGSDFISYRGINLGVTLGWLFIFSSALAFNHTKGIEFGLTYLFLILAIAAWLVMTLINTRTSAPNHFIRPYQNKFVGFGRSLKSSATFVIAGPLAFASSCLVSIFICSYLPMEQTNALVFAGFLFPIVWSLASFWICATSKRLVPTSVVGLSGLLSGLLIFVR